MLTKEILKEEVITFMTTENRPYIQEVIAKVLFSAMVQEILNGVRSRCNTKFVLYNSVNVAPIVISHSSCPVLSLYLQSSSVMMLVNCIITPITDADFFMMKRIKRSRKMSKKWIWNLKEINMDKSMCHFHTEDHQFYTFRITFYTITYAWNMSMVCIFHVAKVEKEAKESSLLLQIMVQITVPTTTKI